MKNVVSIKTNELMYEVEWENTDIMDVIKGNIIEDYANGIKFCDLKVIPSNLYWSNGTQIKNWANGDILDIGDIVTILDENGESILYYDENKTQPYRFKVIDIKTIYEGQVLLELKLQECKLVYEV